MDDEYSLWKYQKNYVFKSNEYNELVVLGDSVPRGAFRPNKIPEISSINLSLGGATPIEMYYTLEHYLDNHDTPRAVILMCGPGHYTKADFYQYRTLYFHYLSLKEVYEVRQYAKQLDESGYLYNSDTDAKTLGYYLRLPEYYLPAVINSKVFGRYGENKALYKQVELGRGVTPKEEYEGEIATHYLNYYGYYIPDQVIAIYLEKIVDICRKNDIGLVIEQTPLPETSVDAMDDMIKDGYLSFFSELQGKYPDVYVNTELMAWPDAEFDYDGCHMDNSGAERLTDYVVLKYKELYSER